MASSMSRGVVTLTLTLLSDDETRDRSVQQLAWFGFDARFAKFGYDLAGASFVLKPELLNALIRLNNTWINKVPVSQSCSLSESRNALLSTVTVNMPSRRLVRATSVYVICCSFTVATCHSHLLRLSFKRS